MKLLLMTYDFPPQVGGMMNYYYNIIQHYNKINSNRSMSVLTLQSEKSYTDSAYPFEVIRLYKTNKYFHTTLNILLAQSRVMRIVAKNKPDALLIGNLRPFGYFARRIYRRFGIPYFLFFHGMDIMKMERKARKFSLFRNFYRRIIHSAAGCFTNSEYTKSILMQYFSVKAENIIVLHPGVVPEDFPPAGEPENPVLITIGRLAPRKGFDIVLQALPAVLKKFPTLTYKIIGGDERPEYKAYLKELIARYNLHNHVEWIGQCGFTKRLQLLQDSTILVMVSKMLEGGVDVEGFGIVYLEANSCSKPVIAADTGGVSDAVENGVNGLLIPSDDIAATAAAIITMLENNELRKRLGQQARQRVLDRFTWERITKKLSDTIAVRLHAE